MGNSIITRVLGVGKVFVKFTWENTLALIDVYHVRAFKKNLASVSSLLNKDGYKLVFEPKQNCNF